MKTIFNPEIRDELIERISKLSGESNSQWGKMNVYQMLKHCTLWDEMMFGKKVYKRAFMGLLFGKMALKSVLKDETPLRRSTPTLPEFVVKEQTGDIEKEKTQWIANIKAYEKYPDIELIHPFFGKMKKEQIGIMVYKHTDHHLRQFGR